MRRHAGWGLFELLISLVLSMLLFVALVEQLVHTKRHILQVNERMSQVVDMQWLTDMLRSRIRAAGFTPCLRSDHLHSVDTRQSPESTRWYEWQAAPLPQLTLRRMAEGVRPVTQVISAREIVINGASVSRKRPIMIADCWHAEVHSQAEVNAAPDGVHVVLNEPLKFNYMPPIYYAEWLSESFFIRKQALFYRHRRVDKLSARVVDLNVEVISSGGLIWLKCRLMLENAQYWSILTRVRSR